jgi:hypothetical protein
MQDERNGELSHSLGTMDPDSFDVAPAARLSDAEVTASESRFGPQNDRTGVLSLSVGDIVDVIVVRIGPPIRGRTLRRRHRESCAPPDR